MKRGEDLLRDLIKLVQHAAGENTFTDNLAEQVEQQIRTDYGGQAVYIAKRDSDARREAVLRDFNGCNRKEVCSKHGIGKAQFYRYLKGE